MHCFETCEGVLSSDHYIIFRAEKLFSKQLVKIREIHVMIFIVFKVSICRNRCLSEREGMNAVALSCDETCLTSLLLCQPRWKFGNQQREAKNKRVKKKIWKDREEMNNDGKRKNQGTKESCTPVCIRVT